MIGQYLTDLPKLSSTIGRGLQEGKWPEVTRAAHSLNSSSAMVGLPTVAALAAWIEALAKEEARRAIDSEFPALLRECDQADAEPRAALEGLRTSEAARRPPAGRDGCRAACRDSTGV